MKNQILKLWSLVKSHKKKSIAAIVVLLIFFFLFGGNGSSQDAKTFVVARGPIESVVRVSGKVKSATDAELAFEKTGTVRTVFKNPGDTVKKGDLIIELESTSDLAALEKARAILKQKRARYALFTDDSAITDGALSLDGENALTQRVESINNGYTEIIAAHNVLYKILSVYLDPFFDNDNGISPKLTFDVSSSRKQIDVSGGSYGERTVQSYLTEEAQQKRTTAQTRLNTLSSFVMNGKNDAEKVFENLSQTESFLEETQVFLIVLGDALNNAGLQTDTLAEYKATLDTAKDALSQKVEDVKNARKTIIEKQLAFRKTTHFVEDGAGGEISADILEEQAVIEEAQATVKDAEATYEKNFLRAPFDGILSTRDVDLGESVKANTVVARVIEPAGLRVEAQIGEIDVPKLSVGAAAEIYFDAYGKDILFPAHVVSIDPGEKDIEGVPTYRTVITLDAQDARIRTGMTVNIEVVAGKKDSALQIPARALISKEGKRFVKVTQNGNTQEKEIETGLRGDKGMIEILSGLSEGEVVQIP